MNNWGNENNNFIRARINTVLILIVLNFSFLMEGTGQITDNPLKEKKWFNVGVGANNADNVSWQGMASFTSRGESISTQVRMAFSQELIESPMDTCTERKNKLAELGLLWGDGWGGRKWYVHGSVGFGLNFRFYCDDADYGYRYLTAVTIGVPAQIEAGAFFNPHWGVALVGMGNWNFRAPYAGATLGVVYRP